MRYSILLLITVILLQPCLLQGQSDSTQIETNKQIAREFYENLWFNNRTDTYGRYVNESYIVHDIGDRKGVREEAIEQKQIADFFWENGELSCEFDYQIAEGDLVATRWIASYQPKTLVGRLFIGTTPLPIINVFRIQNGKIVEIWNHRHDIDTNRTLQFVFKGFLWGLLLALVPFIWAIRLRRKLKRLS